MWTTVTAIEGDVICGTLDSDPVDVASVKAGTKVRVPLEDLSDWMYTLDEDMQGGFTLAVFENPES